MTTMIRFVDWFSGLGGFRLALESTGRFKCAAWSEINKSCLGVHKRRWPDDEKNGVKALGDIRRIRPDRIPDADLWCAGIPCQDLSVAGRRKGLAGKRSGLFFRFVKLLEARRPRFVLLEQVPGLFSSHQGRDMESWLGELAKLGYVGSYRVLDARFFRVAQRRRRVFTLGHLGAERAFPLLVDPSGCEGNLAPRDEKGADASRGAREGASVVGCLGGRGSGGPDDNDAQGGHLVETTHEIIPTIQEREGKGQDSDGTRTMVIVSGALRSNPRNNSDPTTEAKTLIVEHVAAPLTSRQSSSGVSAPGGGKEDDENLVVGTLAASGAGSARPAGNANETDMIVVHSLTAEGYDASEDGTGRGTPIVAFDTTQLTSDKNYSNPKPGDPCHPLASKGHPPSIAFQEGQTGVRERREAGTVRSSAPGSQQGGTLVRREMTVRRLTPTESERLQGFPDGFTCRCDTNPGCALRRIPPWTDPGTFVLVGCGHSMCGCKCADGPRYRMLGNAIAVPVVRGIGERILECLED